MNGKWELYDELISGIPADARVEDYCAGCAWTGVKSAGEWGIALTVRQRARAADESRRLLGSPLREMAELVKSWNFIEASLGMAAINAWYNAPRRVSALGLLASGESGKHSVFESAADAVRGKRVAVVGHFPNIQKQLGGLCELSILEREPQQGDFPDSACEYILPEQDYVFITGMTLTNKTLPRLLELSRGCGHIFLVGPSVPLAPSLAGRGVSDFSAFCVTDPAVMADKLRRGAKQSIFQSGRMVAWSGGPELKNILK